MRYGIVKWYNEGQGRGIIVPDDGSRELMVVHSDIAGEGFKVLFQGQRVRFEAGETKRGPAARNVEVLGG
jgi:CspA family cold shock protein